MLKRQFVENVNFDTSITNQWIIEQAKKNNGIIPNTGSLRIDEFELILEELLKANTQFISCLRDLQSPPTINPLDPMSKSRQEVAFVSGTPQTSDGGDERIASPLVRTVGFGDVLVKFEKIQKKGSTKRTLDINAGEEFHRSNYEEEGVPVPFTSFDFAINKRQLASSTKRGTTIDIDQLSVGMQIMTESLEDLIVNGDSSIVKDTFTAYGYTTYPFRVTGSLAAGSWTASGTPYEDVVAMVQDMYDQNFKGPFVLYLPVAYYEALAKKVTDIDGIRTNYEHIIGRPEIAAIRYTHALATDNVLLVQLTPNVVQWVTATPENIVVYPYEDIHPRDGRPSDIVGDIKFKLYNCGVLMPKSTAEGESGIVHYTA